MNTFKEHILEELVPNKRDLGDVFLNPDRGEMSQFARDMTTTMKYGAGVIMKNGDLLVFSSGILHANFIFRMRKNSYYPMRESDVAERIRFTIGSSGQFTDVGPTGGRKIDFKHIENGLKISQTNKWLKRLVPKNGWGDYVSALSSLSNSVSLA